MLNPKNLDNVPESLLDYRDAAVFLKLKVGTLYSLVHHKQIPHLRLGRRIVRFHATDLRHWLTSHRIEVRNAPTVLRGGGK